MMRGGADVLALSCPVPLAADSRAATGTLVLRAGEHATLGLTHRTTSEPYPAPLPGTELDEALRVTVDAWRAWSRIHQGYQGPWRDLVHHSGRVLQALSYHPTGAVVAAPTTSLPEEVGGERNWDYRYAWVRDASASRWRRCGWRPAPTRPTSSSTTWRRARRAQVRGGRDLQIMFGVGGEHDLTERELAHLAGWRDSRPVRVGNGAWNQRQLDVYGELLGAAHRLVAQLEPGPSRRDDWRGSSSACADAAARAMAGARTRASGRSAASPGTSCTRSSCAGSRSTGPSRWPTRCGATDRVAEWRAAADEIAHAILTRGWNDTAKSFTQSFGSDDLDASNLMMPIVGLPARRRPARAGHDRRRRGPPHRRTAASSTATAPRRAEHRRPRGRGGHLPALHVLAGPGARRWRARSPGPATVFERAVRYVNDVGLLAEEVDPATGDLLGNFPQAFSHIGLVNAAWAIAQTG